MKNLSYFLWLYVVIFLCYLNYEMFFRNYLKEHDLVIIKQNQRCFTVLKELDKQIRKDNISNASKQENSDKDSMILYKAKSIANYDITMEGNELHSNTQKIVTWIAEQDTSLLDFNVELFSSYLQTPLQPAFHTNYLLSIGFRLDRCITQAVKRLTAKIGSVGSGFYRTLPLAVAQSKIVEENDEYKASVFYGIHYDSWSPKKVYLSEGSMEKDIQGNKYITIPSIIPNPFPSNATKKVLNGYVVLYFKWNRDTTIFFSNIYTIKRKK